MQQRASSVNGLEREKESTCPVLILLDAGEGEFGRVRIMSAAYMRMHAVDRQRDGAGADTAGTRADSASLTLPWRQGRNSLGHRVCSDWACACFCSAASTPVSLQQIPMLNWASAQVCQSKMKMKMLFHFSKLKHVLFVDTRRARNVRPQCACNALALVHAFNERQIYNSWKQPTLREFPFKHYLMLFAYHVAFAC